MQKDSRGAELTTDSEAASRLVDGAVLAAQEYRLSAMADVQNALEADPHFVMANVLRGYFLTMVSTDRLRAKVEEAIAAAEAAEKSATPREQAHLAALKAWHAKHTTKAGQIWEQILTDHPLDLLALRMHHQNAFWAGDKRALLRGPAEVFSAWNEDMPGYHALLSMLSFGFEESGNHRAAERHGRESVARNPDDLWGVHAVAHVLEMEERYEEGLAWLDYPYGCWDDRNPFKDHVWWHRALFALESAWGPEAIFEIYDREVEAGESTFYLDVQNCVSLLARLEFLGVDVGHRWQPLAGYAKDRIGDHTMAFTDLHFVWALARREETKALKAELESLAKLAEADNDLAPLAKAVTLPVAKAIADYFAGHPKETLSALLPLRQAFQRLGASDAQRDLFDQLILMAAKAAGQEALLARLVSERRVKRPNSRLTKTLAA